MTDKLIDLELIEGEIFDEEEFEKHKKLPIFKKSLLIRKLVKAVVEDIKDYQDDLNLKQLMLENAYMISAKIEGAEAGELYCYRLENSFSIKRYASELLAEVTLCETKGIGNQKYIPKLIEAIEDLRGLFIEWVDSFDKTKDVADEWDLWQDYGGG
jgi:hypothetical protein